MAPFSPGKSGTETVGSLPNEHGVGGASDANAKLRHENISTIQGTDNFSFSLRSSLRLIARQSFGTWKRHACLPPSHLEATHGECEEKGNER